MTTTTKAAHTAGRKRPMTKVDWEILCSAMGFALAGEFDETFGKDCGFTRERAETCHQKISQRRAAAEARNG